MDHFRDFADAPRPFRHRDSLHAQPELDVLAHRLVRKQCVRLEYHAEPPVARLQVVHHPPVNADLAGARILETGNHAQRRGLAAAGRPHEHDEFAVLDGAAQVLDGLHRTECLGETKKLDARQGYLRTIPKLNPRARCLRMSRPTTISGMVMPTASAAWRP